MTIHRKGEPPQRRARGDRVIMLRGRWYLTTRERLDVGPYDTQEAATIAAAHLAQALDGVDDPAIVSSLESHRAPPRGSSID
jgi:hypothetical protein